MNLSKLTWILVMISAVLLYLVVIGFGYVFNVAWLGWAIFLFLMLLHLSELKTAREIGRKKKLSEGRIFVMNQIFGFTWWLPLKRGIFDK